MPTRDTPLRQTRFANKRLDPIGIEVMTLAELRARVPVNLFFDSERIEFFMLLKAIKGRGEHLIDFERFVLNVGDVVFVRPGQVQQWQPTRGFDAEVLLVQPTVLHVHQHATRSLLRQEDWPAHFTLDAYALRVWQSLVALLRQELDRASPDAMSAAMASKLLVCLLLGIGRSAIGDAAAPTEQTRLARRFRHELESSVCTRPSVAGLASKLGVSTSTLTRISHEVMGHSAKEEVSRRVTLEAQRLLVHSTATSAAIGELLGFSEPTNFVKFFRRRVGMTPDAFRQAHRAQQR